MGKAAGKVKNDCATFFCQTPVYLVSESLSHYGKKREKKHKVRER
jgi:hypothetical protein